MPASFDIRSLTDRYTVAIAPGLLAATIAEPGERVFIVDEFLKQPMLDAGLDPIAIVANEHSKSLDRMTEVIVSMRERRVTRDTTLVAIGGGVVQDAAAFAASVYMRGISWVYLPTTLLSMTDSCIGGKSSINVGKYKNIVGTFHPPVSVVIDPAVTKTLSIEQRAAGLCEAAKICLCRSLDTFDRYLALNPSVDANERVLTKVIDTSLRAKKWFIEIDEFDRAERLVLNFGHTFGHAIETASAFAVSHGIAVGLGMLAALHLGAEMGRDYRDVPQLAAFRAHIDTLVDAVDGLSETLDHIDTATLMDAFQSDKKHTRDHFAVIVATPAGSVERRMLPRDEATTGRIEKAFATMLAERSPPLAVHG